MLVRNGNGDPRAVPPELILVNECIRKPALMEILPNPCRQGLVIRLGLLLR